MCAASGLSPELALNRLIDERVLAQYAEQRGYGELAETQSRAGACPRASAARRNRGSQDLRPGADSDTKQPLRGPQQRLEDLLKELRSKTKVVYDESAVSQALSDDSTLGPGT